MNEKYQKFFDRVEAASKILNDRMNFQAEERSLCDPIYLVLDDWFPISASLTRSTGETKKKWEACVENIREILVLGRELNVWICINLFDDVVIHGRMLCRVEASHPLGFYENVI